MPGRRVIAALILSLAAILAVALANASWLRAAQGRPVLLAHRGLAQQFRREGLGWDTCTATRIVPPTHGYLENTLPSIGAAVALGADVVELDVHPTTDGEFAVFHDWTLDCRTDGHGVTRDHAMAELKRLDIGYGYTADGGRTYPFRGRFVGAMPTLGEVLDAFPRTRFLVNVKSNDPSEGERLARYIAARRVPPGRLMVYGGEAPMRRLRALAPHVRTLSRERLQACLTAYLLTGWTGHAPAACHDAVIFVPINLRRLAWGWPNLFVRRMAQVNSEVFVVGPLTSGSSKGGSSAVDDPRDLRPFIDGYAGGVSTDRIEVMGPYLKRQVRATSAPTPGSM